MDKNEVVNIARKFSIAANEQHPLSAVWLYGSWAYGTPNDQSDIDIAVIPVQEPENVLFAEKQLFKLRRSIDSRIEPIIIFPDKDRSGFSAMITKQGIKVYP